MIYKVIYFFCDGRQIVAYEGPGKGRASLTLVESRKRRDIKKVICVPGEEWEESNETAKELPGLR